MWMSGEDTYSEYKYTVEKIPLTRSLLVTLEILLSNISADSLILNLKVKSNSICPS